MKMIHKFISCFSICLCKEIPCISNVAYKIEFLISTEIPLINQTQKLYVVCFII